MAFPAPYAMRTHRRRYPPSAPVHPHTRIGTDRTVFPAVGADTVSRCPRQVVPGKIGGEMRL